MSLLHVLHVLTSILTIQLHASNLVNALCSVGHVTLIDTISLWLEYLIKQLIMWRFFMHFFFSVSPQISMHSLLCPLYFIYPYFSKTVLILNTAMTHRGLCKTLKPYQVAMIHSLLWCPVFLTVFSSLYAVRD